MSYSAIIISSILLISSCGSSEESKENQHSSVADSIEKKANMSDAKADTIPTPEPPGPGLAPGQAEVKAIILEIIEEKKEDRKVIRLQIQEVLEYGRTTSPIATGDTLQVGTSLEDFQMKDNQEFIGILQESLEAMNKKPKFNWSLVAIKS